MNRNDLIRIVLFIVVIMCIDMIMSFNPNKCNDVESKSSVLRLKRHLLCEYDSYVRPVQHSHNVTQVKMSLQLLFLDYVHEEEAFTLYTLTTMLWNDLHLTWDPAKFDNIPNLIMHIYDIWVPDILMHNIQNEENVLPSVAHSAWITKTGHVQWIIPAKYATFCAGDNTWWPYNIMNCTVQFGSWSYSDDEIDFNNKEMAFEIDLSDFEQHVEWRLLGVYVTTQKEKFKYNLDSTVNMFSYHFILRRHWGIIRIVYVTPAILLMIMTLMALWLEPNSYERMIIANLNFICHLLCIADVHWEMPKSGFNTPKLLIFYERSFMMATFTLILTNILRQLQEWNTVPPVWISSITTSVLHSRIGRILLVSILDPAATAKIEIDADDNTDLMKSNNKRSSWRYITVLVGWLAFLSILLAYVVMLSTCLPVNFE